MRILIADDDAVLRNELRLQKLQSDGLLSKVDAGGYVVTEAGRRAWQVVQAISGQKPASLLISSS